MNFHKLRMGGAAVCVVLILVCSGILAVNSVDHKVIQTGKTSEDPHGVWQQTECYVMDDGVKKNDVHPENAITIGNYGSHYAKCTMHGDSFIGVRMGNLLMWDYISDSGTSHCEITIYTDCLLVNEIFQNSNASARTVVTSSLYTRDGTVPEWFSFPSGGVAHLKWSLASATSLSSQGMATVDGRSIYFTLFYGPTFIAEMEQSSDSGIVTSKLSGMILGKGSDGSFTAITIDSSGDLWYMFYNGSTLSLESIRTYTTHLKNGVTSIERDYEEITDSKFPVFSDGVIDEGMQWHFHSAYMVTMDEIKEISMTGEYSVTLTKGQMFSMSLASNLDKAVFVGYTMPTLTNKDVHFLGIGVLDNTLGMITSAYGTYNATTGTLRFIALTEDAEGNSIVMEFYLHNGAD